MPDGGFLQEQPVPSVASESSPPPMENPVAETVPIAEETVPAETFSLPEGEDDVALAERQAAAQMASEQETFLEEGEVSGGTVTSSPVSEETGTGQVVTSGAAPLPVIKDDVTVEVEKILEEGLQTYYNAMPEMARARFRGKGVEVSVQIANMVRVFHLQAKKVLKLIRDWLLTIPGVNKFFLEQEAKIKTDRLAELERTRREEAQNKP
ncbi:MAG: hypothetical protein Q7N87_02740 [Candidatus Uhrbacteria bacterium]|nr:hypothetical protein [Candidatus Uhrbacteria bacterium]